MRDRAKAALLLLAWYNELGRFRVHGVDLAQSVRQTDGDEVQ
jgi:hypothetical protein